MHACLAFFIITQKIKLYNMGRGDIKTKKGKITAGSFGKTRAAKSPKKVAANKVAAAKKKA